MLQADLLEREEWREVFDALRRELPDRPVLLQGDAPRGYESVPTLEAAATTGPPLAEIAADPCRPSLVLSTGGTTGKPKSVVHCDNTMMYAARKYAEATEYTENDVHVAMGPYGHASGSVFEVYMPLLYGASVLPNARWRAHSVAEAIAQFQGTYALTVGTHLFDLLALEPEADPLLSSLRLVTSGAGADRLFEDVERRFGFKVVRVFGLSECLGHAIGRPGDPAELRLRRDGMPFPGVEFAIVDPDSREPVRQGEVGEYLCRSPSLYMGYFGDAELTAAAITAEGFYRTGDLMTEDPPGYVTWSGRIKHVIRRGGLQIDVGKFVTPAGFEVITVGRSVIRCWLSTSPTDAPPIVPPLVAPNVEAGVEPDIDYDALVTEDRPGGSRCRSGSPSRTRCHGRSSARFAATTSRAG